MSSQHSSHYESGDVGFCEALGRTSALTRCWEDNTVVSVDCGHETCGYSQNCEMYQHYPVGYSHPKSSSSQ